MTFENDQRNVVIALVKFGVNDKHQDPGHEVRAYSGAAMPARRVIATGRITMLAQTASNIASNSLEKGDVLGTARFAGVQAAKDVASYLPLSDPILVGNVTVSFSIDENFVDIEASVDDTAAVGVEMLALTAVTVAALAVYDMCKAADRTMTIGPVQLKD
jgi:cyclic pyranopterin phosphate synthase